MKAIVCTKFGPPEVLQLQDVDKPVPKDGEGSVAIWAASVNPADYHSIRGGPARLIGWPLRVPPNRRLGLDFAGRVVAVGSNVRGLRAGDEVFGVCTGSFVEFACAREDRVARKPAGRSFEEAAAVPVAAITALQGMRDKGRIRADQKVLINGASGGVGIFAVQIAKSYGTEVTGVCITVNLELVRSLGADAVVDYTQEDFTRLGRRFDLIYDAVGN